MKLAATAALWLAAAGCADTDLARSGERAIVAGDAAPDRTEVVAVVARRTACNAPDVAICSGTRVAPRAVLTSAHCLSGVEPDELEVIAGESVAGGEVLAIWRGFVHPDYDPLAPVEEALDLALLVVEDDPGGRLAMLPDGAASELAPGATVRLVGFGQPDASSGTGQRREGVATVTQVEATHFWTDAPAIPCGGDSGGAAFLDTSDGERLVGVIEGSGDGCASPGLYVRVDTQLDSFLTGAVAEAAAMTSAERPRWESILNHCPVDCASHADCPLGMLCLPGRDDAMACGYRDLRSAAFGEVCTGDDPDCFPVGQGSERDCRRVEPCEGPGGGCSGTRQSPGWVFVVVLVFVIRRQGGWVKSSPGMRGEDLDESVQARDSF